MSRGAVCLPHDPAAGRAPLLTPGPQAAPGRSRGLAVSPHDPHETLDVGPREPLQEPCGLHVHCSGEGVLCGCHQTSTRGFAGACLRAATCEVPGVSTHGSSEQEARTASSPRRLVSLGGHGHPAASSPSQLLLSPNPPACGAGRVPASAPRSMLRVVHSVLLFPPPKYPSTCSAVLFTSAIKRDTSK